MKKETRELTDKEVTEFVMTISEPVYKFMLRRIQNKILQEEDMQDISINSFITIIIVSLATMDANFLRWTQKFYRLTTGESVDFDKLRASFINYFNQQIGTSVH